MLTPKLKPVFYAWLGEELDRVYREGREGAIDQALCELDHQQESLEIDSPADQFAEALKRALNLL